MSTRKFTRLMGTVFVIVISLFGAVQAQDGAASDNGGLTEEVAANFVERFDAFFNTPDFEIADEIFAESFQGHLPLAPQLDRRASRYFASFYVPFPDIKQTTHKVLILAKPDGAWPTPHASGEFWGAPTG